MSMTAVRRWTHSLLRATIASTLALAACRGASGTTQLPAAASARAAELLAADRAFAARGANTDMVTAVTAMLAEDVVFLSRGVLVRGRGAVRDSLRANAASSRSKFEWSAIRVGVSADGNHGFTYGYTTLTQPDGAKVPGKYVAYWTREPGGWRVSAYKRVPRPAGEVVMTVHPPALPTAPSRRLSAEDHARAEASLRAAEIAFSDHAGAKGLGPAFLYFGAPDAVNVGGPNDTSFVRGPDAISASVSQGSDGAQVSWAPDIVRVAGSGDLGVSLGYITVRLPATEASQQPRRIAYLTIWRRDSLAAPWRYVAE